MWFSIAYFTIELAIVEIKDYKQRNSRIKTNRKAYCLIKGGIDLIKVRRKKTTNKRKKVTY